MPVIPQISEGIKIGLKTNPAAPPDVVSSITTVSQVTMSMGAMQPAVPFPIPVLPIGASMSMVMTKLEALMFMTFEVITKIIQTLLSNYQREYSKAVAKRDEAEKKLYADEKEAQKNLKESSIELKKEIDQLDSDVIRLTKEKEEEFSKYNAQLFKYREALMNAKTQEERDLISNQIDLLEPWLAKIILKSIEITNKKIDKMIKEMDYNKMVELLELKISNDWEWLEDHVSDFNVVVPYHPDLPEIPSLPQLPPIPNEPPLVKATRQALAKWFATPSVPPLGILISALMTMLAGMAPATPATAAKTESINDALLLQMAGCF